MSDALRARGLAVELGGQRILDEVGFDVATGATIILTLGATFFLALVLRRR